MHRTATRLVAFALLLGACGDDDQTADAPASADARIADGRLDSTPDSEVDASGFDAPSDGVADAATDATATDAPAVAPSRIWAVGDFLTDDHRQAGAFPSNATLPFGPGTPPPLIMPGGGIPELFDGSAATAGVFDARGGKIAYVANEIIVTRFDLCLANANGTGPRILVTGVTGSEIPSVALSPDGTKVAFLRDSPATLDGGYDLFVAPTAGGSPVRLSPDRPGVATNPEALDVFPDLEWSADSRYLAFAGDLTEDGYVQPYVVDAASATPVAVEILTRLEIAAQTSGVQGVLGRMRFDAANDVYFLARVSTDNGSAFQLFRSPPSGAEAIVDLPARGDSSTPEAGAFGITPDGATLVFSADSPTLGSYDLFARPTASSAAPVNLTNLVAQTPLIVRAEPTASLSFSPDGTSVAVVANFSSTSAAPTRLEPHLVRLDGTGWRRLFAVPPACGACDASALGWTGDRGVVVMMGDVTVDDTTSLYTLDPSLTDQTPTDAVIPATNGDLVGFRVVTL